MVASGPQVAKLQPGLVESGLGLVAQSYISQSSPENPLTRPQLHEQAAKSKTKPFLHSSIPFGQLLVVGGVVVGVVVKGVVVEPLLMEPTIALIIKQ